jgi:hypothetical protein
MRLRAHRRNLVVWSSSVGSADRYPAPRLRRPAGTRRIHRWIHLGALVTVIALMQLARAVRPRWRPLLAGVVLTVAGVILHSSMWGLALVPGILFLWSALLIPPSPDAHQKRRFELERELAGYSTPAQRRDLETILDRYPDNMTYELRDILAEVARKSGIPGPARY